MKIAMKISHIISSAVNGHYQHDFFEAVDLTSSVESGINIRRFRAVVQNLNHTFAENMRLRGHTYNFESEEDKHKSGEAGSSNKTGDPTEDPKGKADCKPSEKGSSTKKEKHTLKKEQKAKQGSRNANGTDDGLPSPRNLSYEDSIKWVKDTIVHCRGHELPGSVNPGVTSHLFWAQSEPWEAIARDHIETVREVCKDFIHQILEHAAPTEFKKPLEDLLITSALDETLQDALEEFHKLMNDHDRHPRFVLPPCMRAFFN